MKLASHFQMPFFETSAKTGDCVNECFESLVKIVLVWFFPFFRIFHFSFVTKVNFKKIVVDF